MGASLFRALFPEEIPRVALLNIGSEEIKGNEIIKNTYQKLAKIKKRQIGVYPIDDESWIDVGQWSEYRKVVDRLI